jgi:hypothetical protein
MSSGEGTVWYRQSLKARAFLEFGPENGPVREGFHPWSRGFRIGRRGQCRSVKLLAFGEGLGSQR